MVKTNIGVRSNRWIFCILKTYDIYIYRVSKQSHYICVMDWYQFPYSDNSSQVLLLVRSSGYAKFFLPSIILQVLIQGILLECFWAQSLVSCFCKFPSLGNLMKWLYIYMSQQFEAFVSNNMQNLFYIYVISFHTSSIPYARVSEKCALSLKYRSFCLCITTFTQCHYIYCLLVLGMMVYLVPQVVYIQNCDNNCATVTKHC